jgi:molybdopterin-guanine dinucleotide biosynthesis protein A
MSSVSPRPLAGVVLCGGRSARMGVDKALLDIGGITLLDRVVGRLRLVADPVILASGPHRAHADGCLTVADAVPDHGPLGGLVAALRVTPHHLAAVVAVDMPDCDGPMLAELAACWSGEDAVVPRSARGLEPLHAVYAQSALPHAAAALASPDRSMRGLLAMMSVRVVDAGMVAGPAVASFADNLNVPADVERWLRRAAVPPQPPPRPSPPQR